MNSHVGHAGQTSRQAIMNGIAFAKLPSEAAAEAFMHACAQADINIDLDVVLPHCVWQSTALKSHASAAAATHCAVLYI